MTIGMGTPRTNNRIERMSFSFAGERFTLRRVICMIFRATVLDGATDN
jgi:hypothetical protein